VAIGNFSRDIKEAGGRFSETRLDFGEHDTTVTMALRYLSCSFFLFSWSGIKAVHGAQPELPIIELGYVRQQATDYDRAADLFLFKNIRYAEAPVGELRFRPPRQPTHEPGVTNGTSYGDRVCPQAYSPISGLSDSYTMSEDCLVRDDSVE